MNPDNSSPGGDVPIKPQAGASPNPSPNPSTLGNHQQATANVLRQRIDALYGGGSTPDSQQTPAIESTYHRTHQQHVEPQADQWKAYHTAWQNYYQQYYDNYYRHARSSAVETEMGQTSHYFSNQPTDQQQTEETLSNDQALYELRQKLLGRVQSSAKKIRKSRHFVPIVAALVVVLLFVFVQYNRVFIANVKAYVSPGSIDPQNIVINPTAEVVVSKEPRLIIPKINVDVPALYDVDTDYDSQMKAMEKGVAHFPIPGANSHPGEVGNTVLSGHSSNDLFDPGDYKFIFAQLEKLSKGDTIYANYQGKRYTYVVTKTEVVKPTEVNKLVYPTNVPVMTLITCTPLGTSLNRLLVTAEQVSPDPTTASKAPKGSGEQSTVGDALPGNSPTFLERLFGV